MKKLNVLIILTLIFIISAYSVYREGTLPVNKNDKTSKIFVIKNGQSLNEIANNLTFERLIRNRIVFYLIIKRLGAERKIQAGDFKLSPSMNAYEIIKMLQHGTLDIWVTIIEGLRKEEIAQIISQNFKMPEIQLIKLAEEGYLFPDTYLIPTNASSKDIIQIMRNNFENKYSPELRKKAKEIGLTDRQLITLASLVERETKLDNDRKEVAGIILKRIKNDWPLQIDATLQYVLGYQPEEKTWWKKNLTNEDKKIDSPYNTYKNTGLPPGPIASPGLSSLKAVIYSNQETPYWYYISDKKGEMHYSKTLEEHEANIAKYLN